MIGNNGNVTTDIWKHHHVRKSNDEFWRILHDEELDNFNVKSEFWK